MWLARYHDELNIQPMAAQGADYIPSDGIFIDIATPPPKQRE